MCQEPPRTGYAPANRIATGHRQEFGTARGVGAEGIEKMNNFTKSRVFALAVAIILMAAGAAASEGGGSVYPIGAETVMPGAMPGSRQTMFVEFSEFYQANALMDGTGHNLVPGFHLRVGAVAVKIVHNWGVHALGGEMVSSLALPVLYAHLDGPFGKASKSGLSNPDVGVVAVAYHKGAWHWFYGVDAYLPGLQYKQGDLLNIGQHNFATAPVGAVTYLPHLGQTELSSKFQYIVNFTNPATEYRSGHEFVWEFSGLRKITKQLALGANGDYYQQTSDDLQNGNQLNGSRARSVNIGPQIEYHARRGVFILKYQKEVLAQNKTCGSGFWFEFGVPLGHHE